MQGAQLLDCYAYGEKLRKGEKGLYSATKRLLIKLTHGTRFPMHIPSPPPDSIMCSDVSAVQGASLTTSPPLITSYPPHSSCPIETSMYHAVQFSCVSIMRSNLRATFQPNDMQLYLRPTVPALNCTLFFGQKIFQEQSGILIPYLPINLLSLITSVSAQRRQ